MPGSDGDRPGGSLKKRAAAAKAVHDPFGILVTTSMGALAGNRRDGHEVKLGRGHDQCQSHSVVKARIAVEEKTDHDPSIEGWWNQETAFHGMVRCTNLRQRMDFLALQV